jgi:hypothetical protein
LGKKRVVGTLAAVPRRRRRRRGTGYLTAAAGGGARAGEGENTPGCCLVFLYKKSVGFMSLHGPGFEGFTGVEGKKTTLSVLLFVCKLGQRRVLDAWQML